MQKKQTISRANIKEIYSSVCNGWQEKINELLSEQKFEENIEVDDQLIKTAYSEANDKQKAFIKKHFIMPKKLIERIKSFQDILDLSGKDESEILPYKGANLTKAQRVQNAFAKIQLIEEVLNEGWTPDWKNGNEYKYYPYFEYKAQGGWVYYNYGSHYSGSDRGVPAFFKNSETAIFASKTFINEYKEYLDRY